MLPVADGKAERDGACEAPLLAWRLPAQGPWWWWLLVMGRVGVPGLCAYSTLHLEPLSAPSVCPAPPTVGSQTTEGTQSSPRVVFLSQEIPKRPSWEPGNRMAFWLLPLLCSRKGVSGNTQASPAHGACASFHLPEIPPRPSPKWLMSREAISVASSSR